MSERPKKVLRIQEWALVSNRGAFHGKPGDAKVLTNVRSLAPGRLEVLAGMRPVKFRT